MTINPSQDHGFIAKHNLLSPDQQRRMAEVLSQIEADGLETIRFSFPDQHGVLRGKALMAGEAASAFKTGITMTTTLLAKDTAHKTVYPVFSDGGGFGMAEMTGGGDFIMVPDPSTFRVLPWAEKTGWLLCDIYFPSGEPVVFSTRHLCRTLLEDVANHGYDLVSGLEVECHLFKLENLNLEPHHATQPATPPDVQLLGHGFQYLTEQRFDALEPALEPIRRHLLDVGLPLRSVEVEFGPSQVEFTFGARAGLETADMMILFRSSLKQIARRLGLHASFMCRPGMPNMFSSGWHLHQSLRDKKTKENLFVPDSADHPLSELAQHYVAGLLTHARAAGVFTTPTINGYKRYQPNSLAPDRVVWAHDNRGVMIRAIGGYGDSATRIENRIGEPAANPYLYLASQIAAGLDGIDNKRTLPPAADTPYETKAENLSRSLMEAVDELRKSDLYREKFSSQFVDYIATIKQAEIDRFLSQVTDWEQREYFDIF